MCVHGRQRSRCKNAAGRRYANTGDPALGARNVVAPNCVLMAKDEASARNVVAPNYAPMAKDEANAPIVVDQESVNTKNAEADARNARESPSTRTLRCPKAMKSEFVSP